MFVYNEESRSYWFNSASLESESEFVLVGILMGLAIYNGDILELRFPFVVYRKLLGIKPLLSDLKDAIPVFTSH
jgi:ubiquitin-protein ligase E3 A